MGEADTCKNLDTITSVATCRNGTKGCNHIGGRSIHLRLWQACERAVDPTPRRLR